MRPAADRLDEQCRNRVRSRRVAEPEAVAARDDEPEFTPRDAARIQACLDRPVPGRRDVLVLRSFEEFSYEAIGDVVGRPVGTVRSRLHHAQCALRRALRG